MAAVNKMTFIRNLITGSTEPLIVPGLFAAGSTRTIKRGEIIELTNTGNTIWVPIDADEDFTGTSDAIAVAAEEIKSGDRAGYYSIYAPRPGDVFEYQLAAAGATALGTALYYSASGSQYVTASAANYPIGYACGWENYPYPQGHLADEPSGDVGTTVRSQTYVRMTFKASVSYYLTLSQ